MSETQTTRVKAEDLFEPVLKAITASGPEGITLRELAEATSVRTRILSNVTYRLQKAEKVNRLGEGRKIRYASVEAPKARKPRTRKAAAAKAS